MTNTQKKKWAYVKKGDRTALIEQLACLRDNKAYLTIRFGNQKVENLLITWMKDNNTYSCILWMKFSNQEVSLPGATTELIANNNFYSIYRNSNMSQANSNYNINQLNVTVRFRRIFACSAIWEIFVGIIILNLYQYFAEERIKRIHHFRRSK